MKKKFYLLEVEKFSSGPRIWLWKADQKKANDAFGYPMSLITLDLEITDKILTELKKLK